VIVEDVHAGEMGGCQVAVDAPNMFVGWAASAPFRRRTQVDVVRECVRRDVIYLRSIVLHEPSVVAWRHEEELAEGPFKDEPRRRDELEGTDPEFKIPTEWLLEGVLSGAPSATVGEDVLPNCASVAAQDLSK
jgi:hypothetical protein